MSEILRILELREGIIFKSTGSFYELRDKLSHEMITTRLRGKHKIKGLKVTNPLAVGDRVLYDPEEEMIEEILTRKNYIIRKSVKKTAHGHILAANLDQLALVVTLNSPKTSLGFIDRFLVTAETFRIPTLLIFNKQDLLNEEELAYQEELIGMYESLGYGCIKTSGISPRGIAGLQEQLKNKTTLFSGHSGSGKSTLLNALDPKLNRATQEVSGFSGKGMHTTTFAEMFDLGEETYIIDSPGIKELGVMDIENEELAHYFPEFRALLGQCRFHNCQHISEPDCAVIEALENEEIYLSRYLSYLSIYEGEDNRR